MAANDSGGFGILGVIVGALIVVAIAYLLIGDRLGLRTADRDVNVRVEAPNTPPVTPKSK
jgi:hypothetical protein